ncbi:hypothetical protein BGZ61DRAFT_437061 [Ilyonectria robusta]|uniref:uncharacterized protein n=1 Tax=Ilyonectria robusta TaxID=1079257 RepID=UPI001E8EDC88|nr:uncharacterized protein BGZ61DRAFT_437061 [Ilyonectria robusta]KAH8736797.1 hypothetical protein BGZ61DRAFT_437061 [Ilyonectria robusta]
MCFCAVPVLSGLKRGASASDQLLPQVRPPPFLCCFLVRHATFRTQGQISNCAPIDLDINLGIDLDKQSHQSSNSTICGGCRLDRLVGERASCRISISEHRGPLSLLRPAPATCGALIFDTCFQVGAFGPSCMRDLDGLHNAARQKIVIQESGFVNEYLQYSTIRTQQAP